MNNTRDSKNITNGANQGSIVKQGVVLPIEHDSDPNLIYVHFGDKTANIDDRLDSGIWCHNMLNNYVRYKDILNNPVSYGSHTPILPYTPVMVTMGSLGAGIPMITGFAPTNTNTPDPENRNELHVVSETPKGSIIAIDDKAGNIQLLYEKGNSSIVMGNQAIALEVTKGETSGKTGDTGIFISRGSIEFKLRDSTMKFDETGFSIGFDDSGSYVKINKKGIELHGEDFNKLTSKEQVTVKGSKMTLQGTKDASLSGNQVKVGGKQLTNITGAQIDIRSVFTVQLTGLHVGLRGFAMIREVSPIKESVHPMFDTKLVGISAITAVSHAVLAPAVSIGATTIMRDGIVLSNMGLGLSTATALTTSTLATAEALHEAFVITFTLMLTKVAPVSAANKILADLIAGTSEPAQEPSGFVSNAKDKKDKKTYGTVAATKYAAKKTLMEKYSTVSNLVAASKTALLNANTDSGGSSFTSLASVGSGTNYGSSLSSIIRT